MDILLSILIGIAKAAKKIGLLDYLKTLGGETASATYEKVVQDKFIDKTFLRKLFTPDFKAVFKQAFAGIAPKDRSAQKRFVLAVLTDPDINKTLSSLERGVLPQKQILLPVFKKALPQHNPNDVVNRFLDNLKNQISADQKKSLRVLLNLPERIEENYELLLEIRELLQIGGSKQVAESKFKISTARLPTTRSELFGREKELQLLDAAWADEHTHLVSFVAWGGVGKTALVNEWLSRLERDHFRGAERVFGWSFYSQGTKEDRNVSADSFFDEALRWFGYSGPPILSPWDKGVRLAELLRQQKTLLILDGVEPLQYPPGPLQGELKDQGLKALLKELARTNLGLCVVTTRIGLKDIAQTEGKSSRVVILENLSAEASSRLLRYLQVKGTDKELAEASQEFSGHALALTLLGRYLTVVHEGEIRKRDLIPHLTEEEEQGGHARRVMESYERWFLLSAEPIRQTGFLCFFRKPGQFSRELSILYKMGLFDRPAAGGAVAVLRRPPAINGLTAGLTKLSDKEWQYTLKRLRDLHLIAEKDARHPDTLDCHPLVREHFGEKLRKQNPTAWKEAHSRLYKYYKKIPAKELPDTFEEMEPLFAAVTHGCQAGFYNIVWEEVYQPRINRYEEGYCETKLGAFGAHLMVLSNFFKRPWYNPAPGFSDRRKAAALSYAGFGLRALGRLAEATEPMQASLKILLAQKDWKAAAAQAGNLSELYLGRGDVPQAVLYARQSLDYARHIWNWRSRMMFRTVLANALHQAGDLSAAEKLFRKAETIQRRRQWKHRYLYSLQGHHFCDLLLSQGQVAEVLQRVSRTLEWAKQHFGLLSIALDTLSLGRAHFMQVIGGPQFLLRPESSRHQAHYFKPVEDFLNQTVSGLREAGVQDYVSRGLLARAALYRMLGEFNKAKGDLEEAREIAERGDMKLFLADYHLEASRLSLAQHATNTPGVETSRRDVSTLAVSTPVGSTTDHLSNARQHVATAKEMIEKMGYGRRRPEVEALQRELEAL